MGEMEMCESVQCFSSIETCGCPPFPSVWYDDDGRRTRRENGKLPGATSRNGPERYCARLAGDRNGVCTVKMNATMAGELVQIQGIPETAIA